MVPILKCAFWSSKRPRPCRRIAPFASSLILSICLHNEAVRCLTEALQVNRSVEKKTQALPHLLEEHGLQLLWHGLPQGCSLQTILPTWLFEDHMSRSLWSPPFCRILQKDSSKGSAMSVVAQSTLPVKSKCLQKQQHSPSSFTSVVHSVLAGCVTLWRQRGQ